MIVTHYKSNPCSKKVRRASFRTVNPEKVTCDACISGQIAKHRLAVNIETGHLKMWEAILEAQ